MIPFIRNVSNLSRGNAHIATSLGQDTMVPSFGMAPTTRPTAARVRTARFSLLGLFALLGMLVTTFLSRMPSLRDLMDVTPAGLALLILSGALGALAALVVAGWSTARFGTRSVLWWSGFGYMAALAATGLGAELSSKPLFSISYFFVSFTFALANVAVNAEAAEVERRHGRSIMPQFHAGFSVGMGLGLAVGAAASHWHLAVGWHFAAVGVFTAVTRAALIPFAVIDGTPDPRVASATLGGPFATAGEEYKNRRVLLIGAIVFAAAMTEMIAAQWLALSIVDDFGGREAQGDIVYWVFVAAMFSVRMGGSGIIDRIGRVKTLRISSVVAAIGVVLYAFTPSIWLVPLAVVLWGAGAGLNYPIGFSAAADDPKRAAARVAAVSSFSTVAGLLVPQIVGNLGAVMALRHAMLLVLIGSVVSFVLARAVRTDARLFRSRRAQVREVGANVLSLKAKRAQRGEAEVIDAAGQTFPVHQQDE